MPSNLKQQTILGLIWASIQKFGTMIISFASNILLARFLSPEDYGCIGLLSIFMVVANVFVNGGFASALVQKKEPSKEDYSTVFVWNIVIAIFSYILLFVTAPYIAQYYKNSLLESVLQIQGIVLLINALSVIQLNILRKQMEFKKMSIIQLVAAIVSVFITIVLAYKGWGVWALVVQQIIFGLITTILLWGVNNWRPSWCFSIKSFKELFGYGAFLLLSDLLNGICDNIQGLIIGGKFTSMDMGYYSQAKKLEEVPTQSISYVVSLVSFPVFAKLQDDASQLNVAFRKSLRLMNYINIPLMLMLIIVAEPLITVLFTEKWLSSVPYFKILCIAGIVNCMQSINYQVVCAVGKSREIFKWNVVKRIVGLGFILLGVIWGIQGLLWGMVLGFYFTAIVNAMVATKITDYNVFLQIKDSMPTLIIALFSALISYTIGLVISYNQVMILCIQIVFYIAVYVLMSKLLHRQELSEYVVILKSYLKKE